MSFIKHFTVKNALTEQIRIFLKIIVFANFLKKFILPKSQLEFEILEINYSVKLNREDF